MAAVDTSAVPKKKPADDGVDAELVGRLVEQARAAGLQLTGDGGLLQQLTKRVIEAAMDGEITDHLGYGKHDPAGPRVPETWGEKYPAIVRLWTNAWAELVPFLAFDTEIRKV